MIRRFSLLLLAAVLGACASAPQSETESLVHDVVTDRSAPLQCAATKYCVTSGSRIAGKLHETCSCNPPPAMFGRPVGR
jgi:hypothetical protein